MTDTVRPFLGDKWRTVVPIQWAFAKEPENEEEYNVGKIKTLQDV